MGKKNIKKIKGKLKFDLNLLRNIKDKEEKSIKKDESLENSLETAKEETEIKSFNRFLESRSEVRAPVLDQVASVSPIIEDFNRTRLNEEKEEVKYTNEERNYSVNTLNSLTESETKYEPVTPVLKPQRRERLFTQDVSMIDPLAGRAQFSREEDMIPRKIEGTFKNEKKWVPFESEKNEYYELK